MDLEKYIERDIEDFLEKKDLERKEKREVITEEEIEIEYTGKPLPTIVDKELEEKKVKIKKDIDNYYKKIFSLLKKNKISEAMKEYKKMRIRFKEYPDEPQKEKEALFEDLITGYYEIKKFEKLRVDNKKKQDAKKNALLEKAKVKIIIRIKRIKMFLKNNDLKMAMKEYENTKKDFEKFPKEMKKEHKIIYQIISKLYNEIKKRVSEEKLKKKTVEKVVKKENTKKEPKTSKTDILIELKNEIKGIIGLMKNNRAEEATLYLLEVKQKINLLPDDKEKEKKAFEHIIDEISHRLNFLKQTMEMGRQNA